MFGAVVLGIIVVVAAAGVARLIYELIRRPGYICENGHWQMSGSNNCKTCGQPVRPYNDPRCSNGHQIEEGKKFCGVCGGTIVERQKETTVSKEHAAEDSQEEPQKKHRLRRVLAWGLGLACFAGLVWGATYQFHVKPWKEEALKSQREHAETKRELKYCEEKYDRLNHAGSSLKEALKISKERGTWRIITWHIEKGEGVISIKKISGSDIRFSDREKKIRIGSSGIESWSQALRSPGDIRIEFNKEGWGSETGDHLKPVIIN